MRLLMCLLLSPLVLFPTSHAADAALPGQGITVQPLQSSIAEETFQTLLVVEALKTLGYAVNPIQEIEYATGYVALGNGDGTFMANSWMPLHGEFYKNAGGDEKLQLFGPYIPNGLQGYLVDKATAERLKFTNLGQLKDPALAQVFDTDGDGKADLTGCTAGWGCERAINHHLQAYALNDTVVQNSGSYNALVADMITRFKANEPVLYYTWTPYWLSGVLVPGRDVVWLQVPFSASFGADGNEDTALADGTNYGFAVNNQMIAANRAWVAANPAAARLFAAMGLSSGDVNAQNLRMQQGESDADAIAQHIKGWIQANQATFDGWIQAALAE